MARSEPGRAAGATGSRTARVDPSSLLPKWTSIMKNVISCRTTSSRGVRLGLSMPLEREAIGETPSSARGYEVDPPRTRFYRIMTRGPVRDRFQGGA